MHDGGCAGENSTDTGATDPTMVSPGHPHHFGWLGCLQQPLAAERGCVSPRRSGPPGEFRGSTTP